jgi:hypothetical protein
VLSHPLQSALIQFQGLNRNLVTGATRDCVRHVDERSAGLEEEQARIFAKTSRDASVSAQSDDGARHEHGDHPPLSILRYAGSMNRWIGARPTAQSGAAGAEGRHCLPATPLHRSCSSALRHGGADHRRFQGYR